MLKKDKESPIVSKTIQSKILIPFIILIAVTGMTVAAVSYYSTMNTVTNELTKNVESQMVSFNDSFELFFANVDNTIDRFTSNELLTNYQQENKEAILKQLQETKDADDSIAFIYTGIEETAEMIDPAGDLDEDYNPKEREWYIQAVESKGETIWTEPYVDEGTNNIVITAARAYYNQNKLVGVFALDVSVDTILEMTNSIRIGDSGYVVVFDQTGKFISNPNQNQLGAAFEESITGDIKNVGKQGTVEFQVEGNDYTIAFVENATTGWRIGGIVNKADFESKAKGTLATIITTLVIILLIAVVISFMITRKITKPINTVVERMKLMTNGDLSQEPLQILSKDETGKLADGVNRLQMELSHMIHNISNNSEVITKHSGELNHSADEVKYGSEQIAITMGELASGAEKQSDHINTISFMMTDLSKKVQEANQHGENIYESSKSILSTTNNGSELMEASTNQMLKINEIVKESVQKVNDLDEQAQEISKLVTVIKSVADQTNLLSLNAAIEAARAGEHGKGFAVVADEVRKLSEQVSHSITEITEIVKGIQNEFHVVKQSLKDGYDEVENGTTQINMTHKTFSEISAYVQEMANSINTISTTLVTIAGDSEKMNASIQEIAAISEESSAGIEQTAAASQETSSLMEEVAGSSANLKNLATSLNELTRKFKL